MSRRRIAEIEADIARTRARLEETLQRIEHKLSASGMIEDALASLRRTRHDNVADRAMAVLRDNPVPVLAVMAGIGWLIGQAGARRTNDRDDGVRHRAPEESRGDGGRSRHEDRDEDRDEDRPGPNPSRSDAFSRRSQAGPPRQERG